MRTLILALVIVATTAPGAIGQITATAEQEPMIAERQWETWFMRKCGDPKIILETVFSDDYTIVGLTARSYQKLPTGESHCHDYYSTKTDDVSLRLYGDAAVVTGHLTLAPGGNVVPAVLIPIRYTNVYVKGPKRWQLVATQFTRVELS